VSCFPIFNCVNIFFQCKEDHEALKVGSICKILSVFAFCDSGFEIKFKITILNDNVTMKHTIQQMSITSIGLSRYVNVNVYIYNE
jgi:hypothetical protein